MDLIYLEESYVKLDGILFNGANFSNHPDREYLISRINELGSTRVFLVKGQNFHHVSLWSVVGSDTEANVAKSIVDKFSYVGEYTYCFLN